MNPHSTASQVPDPNLLIFVNRYPQSITWVHYWYSVMQCNCRVVPAYAYLWVVSCTPCSVNVSSDIDINFTPLSQTILWKRVLVSFSSEIINSVDSQNNSVSDPVRFRPDPWPDPDPCFFKDRIRIPDPGSLIQIYQTFILFINFVWVCNCHMSIHR